MRTSTRAGDTASTTHLIATATVTPYAAATATTPTRRPTLGRQKSATASTTTATESPTKPAYSATTTTLARTTFAPGPQAVRMPTTQVRAMTGISARRVMCVAAASAGAPRSMEASVTTEISARQGILAMVVSATGR